MTIQLILHKRVWQSHALKSALMPGNEALVLQASVCSASDLDHFNVQNQQILVKVPIHSNLLLYVASRITPELVVQVLSLYILGRKSTWKSPDSHPSVT